MYTNDLVVKAINRIGGGGRVLVVKEKPKEKELKGDCRKDGREMGLKMTDKRNRRRKKYKNAGKLDFLGLVLQEGEQYI